MGHRTFHVEHAPCGDEGRAAKNRPGTSPRTPPSLPPMTVVPTVPSAGAGTAMRTDSLGTPREPHPSEWPVEGESFRANGISRMRGPLPAPRCERTDGPLASRESRRPSAAHRALHMGDFSRMRAPRRESPTDASGGPRSTQAAHHRCAVPHGRLRAQARVPVGSGRPPLHADHAQRSRRIGGEPLHLEDARAARTRAGKGRPTLHGGYANAGFTLKERRSV